MNSHSVIKELERLYEQYQAANELDKAYDVLKQINILKTGLTENTQPDGTQLLYG